MNVPFYRLELSEDEIKEVNDTLRSGWIGTGPKTKKFEEEFKKFIGSEYALAISSCTAGLHLSLIIYGIKNGDEVITTPLTFSATANVIVHTGAKPVFVDVERETGNISPSHIESAISNRTKAIIPVHLYGMPCDMDKIMEIAKRYGLKVIEDAAHALGAIYKGKKIGTIGDATSFSFYATKNITTGEGGMLTTNDINIAERVEIMRLHGLSRDAWKRYVESTGEHYEVLLPGFKYNLTDIQASIGIHQLRRFNELQKRREEIWERYDEEFSGMEEIELLQSVPPDGSSHSRHLYTILIKTEKLKVTRDEFVKELNKNGVGTGIHFVALHLHSFYREVHGYRRGMFPNAEYISDRTISLPFFPYMKDEEVEYVIKTVKKVILNTKK